MPDISTLHIDASKQEQLDRPLPRLPWCNLCPVSISSYEKSSGLWWLLSQSQSLLMMTDPRIYFCLIPAELQIWGSNRRLDRTAKWLISVLAIYSTSRHEQKGDLGNPGSQKILPISEKLNKDMKSFLHKGMKMVKPIS